MFEKVWGLEFFIFAFFGPRFYGSIIVQIPFSKVIKHNKLVLIRNMKHLGIKWTLQETINSFVESVLSWEVILG